MTTGSFTEREKKAEKPRKNWQRGLLDLSNEYRLFLLPDTPGVSFFRNEKSLYLSIDIWED